uniref:Uncharacterized protein n=1 Tax=Arundo donax TaxID=35708 RepID=A0A0A9ETF5_ARUDO
MIVTSQYKIKFETMPIPTNSKSSNLTFKQHHQNFNL